MSDTVRESTDLQDIFVMQMLTMGVVSGVGLMIGADTGSFVGDVAAELVMMFVVVVALVKTLKIEWGEDE